MFTRCSTCRTVFHITAAELRAAEGTVICGACGATFDALDSLSETRPKDPLVSTPPEPSRVEPPADEKLPATEELERDQFARDEDEFLEELESLIGGEEPDDEEIPAPREAEYLPEEDLPRMDAAAAPLLDAELAAELMAEGDLPEGESDESEFLVEDFSTDFAEDLEEEASRFDAALIDERRAGQPPAHPLSPEHIPAGDEPHAPMHEILDDDLGDFDDPDSVFRVDELDDEPGDAMPQAVSDGDGDGDDDARRKAPGSPAKPFPGDTTPAHDGEQQDPAEQERGGSADAGADDGAVPPEPLPEFASEARGGRTWVRVLLALVAVLLLAGTWAHTQRGKLLRHPTGETLLTPVYRVLGIDAAADWNPAEFRAVQWEAIADADRPDDLTVAVDFMNMAAYAQPYPVIRVVLEDRFGRRLGTHDIPPEQYLSSHSSGSRLPAGSRVRTTVRVRDPGARADGFRVDFCLELPGRGLVCGPEPFR